MFYQKKKKIKNKRKHIIINPEEKDEDIKIKDSNDSTKYNQISNENEISKNSKCDERNNIIKNMKNEEIDFQFNNDNQNQDSKINNLLINNLDEENKKELRNNNIIFFDDISANEKKEKFEKLKIHFENVSKEEDIKIIKKIVENMDYNKVLILINY